MSALKPSISDLHIEYFPADQDRAPFVFIHGNSQNSSCGYGLVEFFKQRGHSILIFDLPGHGRSGWGPFEYHFDDLVDLNIQVLKHYNIERPILCGHSLGGMIQAATTIRLEQLPSSLILCGSLDCDPIEAIKRLESDKAFYLQASLEEYLEAAPGLFKQQKFYDYFANRSLDDAFVEILNRRYSQPAASRINLTTLAKFNVRSKLSKLGVPILVIHGEQETVIPMQLVQEMAEHYSTMKVEWLEGAGHNGFYQQHEATITILNRYYSLLNSQS